MRRSPLLMLLLIAAPTLASAPPRGDDGAMARRARERAQEAGRAMVAGDFPKLVDLTYPKVVAMVGGREKMIAGLKRGTEHMAAEGIAIKSAEVDAPSGFGDAGDDLVAIVPLTLEMTVPGGALISKGFLVGISPDRGKTWTFIDGAKLTNETVKKVLPKFPDDLKLPARGKPDFKPAD